MKTGSLLSSYVHLKDDRSALTVAVTPEFWPELMSGKRSELDAGRLILQFDFTESWSSWERHPLGDEIGILLSGEVEVLLEQVAGVERVKLSRPGEFVLIPRGVWHTARVIKPASMIFVTPGEGTEHRAA